MCYCFFTEGSTFVKIECGLFSFVSSQLLVPVYSGFVGNKAMICSIFFLLWAGGDFMTSISHKKVSYPILCSHLQEFV